jgi:hypothetical protein
MANVYERLIERVFLDNYKKGAKVVEFAREEIEKAAQELGIGVPKNLGDTIYSFRYRRPLPKAIIATAPKGLHWQIEGAGRSRYRFTLTKGSLIVPREDLLTIKVPDATPEIIAKYALSDEQALLAKVRYNRLVDVFLAITAYSLQSHLRTTVKDLGQIEIDELYVGLNRSGMQFIIPIQAKGGKDQLSFVQARQDIACCAEKFPNLVCRSVSAQFMAGDVIAMFEIAADGEDMRVVEERHYKLVPADAIGPKELAAYRRYAKE